LWIGPRQTRPYHPAYTPVTWRDFWAFGTGAQGDFGCHDLDAAFWALDLGQPNCVDAKPAGYTDAEIAPHGEICYFHFGPRGNKPPVRVTWYTGGLMPANPEELGTQGSLPGRGVLFVGEKGKMLCDGAGGLPRLLPYEKTREYQKPAPTIPRSKGHHRDWLDACKGGKPASGNFDYASRLSEVVLLGVLSLRCRKRIYWDAANMKATGLAEADAIIRESCRAGWEVA
jgi:predicted dehydrogenase